MDYEDDISLDRENIEKSKIDDRHLFLNLLLKYLLNLKILSK